MRAGSVEAASRKAADLLLTVSAFAYRNRKTLLPPEIALELDPF
jgi:hypothetical protein